MAEKKDKLDWFPLYVYEFITDILGWTNAEVGAYFRLLCVQWINEELPGDLASLARIVHEPIEDFKLLWERIGKKFTIENGKHCNAKLEKIRRQQNKKIDKLSAAGSEGAEARWGKNKAFVPPTIAEVRAYCIERKNGIDPEAFFSFYESKGWMIGRNKMKNWRMAVITWEKGRKTTGNFQQQPTSAIAIKRPEAASLEEKQKTAELHKSLENNPPKEDKKQGGLGSLIEKQMDKLAPKTTKQ